MNALLKESDILEMTISNIHNAMNIGTLTSRHLVETYIRRINAFDHSGPSINSIIKINPNALQIADRLDDIFKTSGPIGPLHGIPVLIKDNINTSDMETTAGSISLNAFIPNDDAFIINALKNSGAIIFAKVNLHEFAIWGETRSSILGQTLNPYDLTRTPGGSSGGTGASVASNFGMVGIGTDTVNSVRSPASACNLVGFRPTVGLVSRSGIVPYSLTQDTAGPLARTVEDSIKLLDVISGQDPMDTSTLGNSFSGSYSKYLNPNGLAGKRIGVLKDMFGKNPIHADVNEIINNALVKIKALGGILVDIDDEINTDKLVKEVSVHLYEFKRDLNKYLKDHSLNLTLEDIINSGKFDKGIEENIRYAQTLDTTSPDYQERLTKRNNLRTYLNELMSKYNLDAFVYPHQKRPVVKIGESQIGRNGVLASITGFPACSVPAGFTSPTQSAPLGIPVGIEFLSKEWDEPTLIEIVYSFEQATKHRKPPYHIL